MAALRVGQLRRRAADEPLDAATVAQARMRLDTTERYDEAHGVKSLQSLHRVLRAQLLTETGEYAQARALYDAHIDTALNEGLGAVAGTLMADQAWCRLQLGDRDGALDRARHAEAHLHQATIHGDRAPAHDRLAQIFGVLKREQEAARHRELAQAAWQGHADDQAHLLRALSTLQPHRPA